MDDVAKGPEEELLLQAARAHFQPDCAPLLRLIVQRPLDWKVAAEKAETHGLLPLLFRQIEENCPDAVPPDEFDRLRTRFNENGLRMLLLSCELIRLLQLLDVQGISAVSYKGPALASYLYGDISMRRSDDLDILIRKGDIWRASDVFESQGYRRHPPVRREQMPAYSRSECDMSFVHSKSGRRVELHWAFVPPYHGLGTVAEQVWDRLETMDLLGRMIPALSLEDHLHVLCIHGSKHRWSRLEWVCGIAALMSRARPVNWERVLEQARLWGSERGLLLGLLLAHQLLGADLPAPAQARIRSTPVIGALAQDVCRELFSQSEPGLLRSTRFRLQLIEGLSGRIRYCAYRALLPSYKDLGWIRLPVPLSFLYFFLRPIRLAITRVRAKVAN